MKNIIMMFGILMLGLFLGFGVGILKKDNQVSQFDKFLIEARDINPQLAKEIEIEHKEVKDSLDYPMTEALSLRKKSEIHSCVESLKIKEFSEKDIYHTFAEVDKCRKKSEVLVKCLRRTSETDKAKLENFCKSEVTEYLAKVYVSPEFRYHN